MENTFRVQSSPNRGLRLCSNQSISKQLPSPLELFSTISYELQPNDVYVFVSKIKGSQMLFILDQWELCQM